MSRVSQHWRSLALGAPELWTNIPLRYSRWAQEMLIRSKMAKLTIRLPFESSNSKAIEAVRPCLYEMNRVEKIDLAIIESRKLEEIFKDLPKSAPQLHTLRIRRLSFLPGTFSIHEDLLHDTERLQHVELTNCKISWDSRLLTGLTRLTLENSLMANSSITQFLQALQRMPALTDLHLIDSIPDDSEGPSTYDIIDLPCLRILRISSGVGALTTLLRHITFPHSAILNLTCRENQSNQIDFSNFSNFSNFLSVLVTKFLSSLVIRSLSLKDFKLHDTERHGLEFHLWTIIGTNCTFIQDFFPSSRTPAQLELVLTWPSPQPRNHVKALTCAMDAMGLPFLSQLSISSTLDFIDPQTWVETFGKLPLLERVYVQNYTTDSFFKALVYKTEAAEESYVADVSFSKLRHIHVVGTYFIGTNPGSFSVDLLLDYLSERCERNAEVEVLHLNDCCYISSNEVERLREIVDVIWEGNLNS